jgi:hypothetical protein
MAKELVAPDNYQAPLTGGITYESMALQSSRGRRFGYTAEGLAAVSAGRIIAPEAPTLRVVRSVTEIVPNLDSFRYYDTSLRQLSNPS